MSEPYWPRAAVAISANCAGVAIITLGICGWRFWEIHSLAAVLLVLIGVSLIHTITHVKSEKKSD